MIAVLLAAAGALIYGPTAAAGVFASGSSNYIPAAFAASYGGITIGGGYVAIVGTDHDPSSSGSPVQLRWWVEKRPKPVAKPKPGSPEALTSRSNLAAAYQEAGRTAEAIALYEQTLAARERLLGPDHPDT